MAEKTLVSRSFALSLGRELVDIFQPAAEGEVEFWGSIRRGEERVGDLEIGMRPKLENVPDPSKLFSELTVVKNHQYELASRLRAEGVLRDRLDVNGRPAFGRRMQRMLYKGMAVDFFIVLPPAQFGVLKFIRTGPKDFSHRCMTQRAHGGNVLDIGMRVEDGVLYDRGRPIETPTELDFFNAIGLAYVEPKDRA